MRAFLARLRRIISGFTPALAFNFFFFAKI